METTSVFCRDLPRNQRGRCKRKSAKALKEAWLQQLTWGPEQQRSWDVQLWLGVFPVHWRQLPDPSLLSGQIDAISGSLNGTYSDLLVAMVTNPALQISLNGPSNHRRHPNENFSRELLELFSVGEGNFSESDVSEAARALTGYRLNQKGELELVPHRHDLGQKTVLGKTAAFDAVSLAQWLAQQPTTAEFIARRVWRYLIGTIPPAQRLQELGRTWRIQGLSLPWLMSELRMSPEAKQSRNIGLRLSDPLDLVTRSLRVIGSRHSDAIALSLRGLRAMGQAPFEPPNVAGWPVNEQWINLRWLQARRRTILQLLRDEEVWDTRSLPSRLDNSLTGRAPLTMTLPVEPDRETLAQLFSDPVWQLS
jgi:uncharacterized protein (DUF1800 family)